MKTNWQDPVSRRAYFREFYRQKRIKQLKLVAKDKPVACFTCGATENLQVDHIDPSTKTITISKQMYHSELSKCQILCKSCHYKKTGSELTKPIIHGSISAFTRKHCKCDVCMKAHHIYKKSHRGGTADSRVLKTRSPSESMGANPIGGTI